MLTVGGLPQPGKSIFAQTIPDVVLPLHDVEDLLPVLAIRDFQLLDLLRCRPSDPTLCEEYLDRNFVVVSFVVW